MPGKSDNMRKISLLNDKDDVAIAACIISARYTPQYGISIEEIADYLIAEMDNDIDGHRGEFAADFGEPYIDKTLNIRAFEKWLEQYVNSRETNNFDCIEKFLLHN